MCKGFSAHHISAKITARRKETKIIMGNSTKSNKFEAFADQLVIHEMEVTF